jgi:tetratricopeptide (TPR) repeat protein
MGGNRSARSEFRVSALPTKPVALLAIVFLGTAIAQDARPVSRLDAITSNNEGARLSGEGRDVEAEKLYLAALGTGYDDDLLRAKIASNLALLYRHQDRYRDAELMFRRALEWRQKNLPAGSIDIAYSLNNLGEIYRIQGREWEARNLMETAVRSLEPSHSDVPAYPSMLGNLAIVIARFGEFDQAEQLLRSALLLYESRQESASREYGVTLGNLSQVLEATNKLEAAVATDEQAIAIFQRLGNSARADLAGTLANTGELYQRLLRMKDARQAEEQALDLLSPEGDAALRAQILRHLGNILANAGSALDSLPYFEHSLLIEEKTFGAEHPATARLLLDYSAASERAGKKSLSRKLRQRALESLTRLNRQSPGQMTVSVRELRANK